MKKTITLLGMLLAFFATAGAQTAAKFYSSTATPYADLVSGKSYAILVAADKNCVDGDANYTTAKFLSWATKNGGKATTDAYTSTNDLRGKEEQNGYTWVVTVNSDNNTITLKTGDNTYVPASSNGQGGALSATAGELTRVDKGDWCLLTNGTYDSKTCYLTLGGDKRNGSRNKLEYWRYDANPTAGEIAKFKFFEVLDVTSYDVTYNYTINGTQVGTYSVKAVSGNAYPTPGNLPDFVTATAPEGTVAENTTKTIEVNISNYPFKFSLNESDTPEWGYLTGNISTDARKLFTNNTTSIVRLAANAAYQNSTLNGIADDLWRMVGNPFDGFKIMNKSGKCLVKAASGNGATYTDASATASDNLWKVYGGDIIGEPGNITDANKEELKAKAFVLRHSTVDEGDNYLNPGGIGSGTSIGVYYKKSNGSCFLFLEPEFTVNLNTTDNLVASFATLALPFDFKVASSNTNDAKLYSGAYNATTSTLDMTAVEGVVPASAGVVIKSDSKATSIVLTANTKSAATALTGNQLVGTTEEIAFSELTGKLVFGVTAQNHVGFYAAGGSAALPANRAYLPTSVLGGENAVAMNFGGNVTGINAVVKADKANAAIYDLTGRRVTRTVKGGLYIQNGSKFVAR
ncbi:hypothetical protein [uncultured Prevotellamassilia sp.]|uniref:hypothetical protein n=1 Tax=uncultured Prevotellamassilia sp. TaxID=1926676 RepID=UPI00258E281C|nr:hypothetical protein [uncultured Prevotellamassilia sp.]